MICVRQIKNHTQAIKQSVLLVENIRMLIEYNNLSLKEIFENISKKDTYNLLEFLNTINYGIDDYNNTLDSVFSEKSFIAYLDKEDCENFKGFLSMLGKSDTDGQILNCNLYKNLFEKKYLQLENDEISRCKSTITLTMCFGMLFLIVAI